jgi:hypothetical protein
LYKFLFLWFGIRIGHGVFGEGREKTRANVALDRRLSLPFFSYLFFGAGIFLVGLSGVERKG